MFEEIDTKKELSTRLRQDMNPEVRGKVEPSSPTTPAEDIFNKAEPEVRLAPPPISDSQPEPKVEVAPFVSQVSDWRKSYLAWAAGLLVMPSIIFWLASLFYTTGYTGLLLKIVTSIPFLIIVILNIVLPILAIVAAVVLLWLTESGDKGRLMAKISIILAAACLLVLIWWFLAEAF